MSEFKAVSSIEDWDSIDEAEFADGYIAGNVDRRPEPTNCSRSHWFGWYIGAIDAGDLPPDPKAAAVGREALLREINNARRTGRA